MTVNAMIDFQARTKEAAFKNISARLKSLFDLFELDGVTEVNYNGSGVTFVTRMGRREEMQIEALSEVTAAQAVTELAASMGQEAEAGGASGIVDAKMPGYRFSAILFPVAANGTAFSIRKHSPRILSLEDYVKFGTITEEIAATLREAVREGKNILISGGTDSGKTTFLNALLREVPTDERVGTIEDTRELQCSAKNWIALEINKQKGVTATIGLKALMRQSPDRIICGELRDSSAMTWIESGNTGHTGIMATVHSNSASLALERIEDLCASDGVNTSFLAVQRSIGRTINMVAQFKKSRGVRRLIELVEVGGFDMQKNIYRINHLYKFEE